MFSGHSGTARPTRPGTVVEKSGLLSSFLFHRYPYGGSALVFIRFLILGIAEFTTTTDERIRLLSAKLLRAENPSVIMAVAEQLKIAIDAYVRERTLQIPAIKEIVPR